MCAHHVCPRVASAVWSPATLPNARCLRRTARNKHSANYPLLCFGRLGGLRLMTFSSDPHLGMTDGQFTGSAVVFPATVTFSSRRTASLQ